MFSLIQRGQMYADSNGWPVKICSSGDGKIVYRRHDGQLRSVPLSGFNDQFEYLDYSEYRKITAEIERDENIRHLRSMRGSVIT
ncbi:DUF4222 domain-containing protein [Salmonella enterica]|nr:DUF4222 domain-containing protein [Salmonella enterica]